jgi:DNA-directed RNA polymerase specialized sigma24 family protein
VAAKSEPRRGPTPAQQRKIDADLDQAASLTARLRRLEAELEEAKGDRRIVFARLRKAGVTAQKIADRCGITDAAVHATLRKG